MATTIIRAEYGSRAYGTNTHMSDRDMVEIVVEPKEYVTGLLTWDNVMTHTAEEGMKSGPNDVDTTVYGLKKFAALAAAGNPSILAVLFLSSESYELLGESGQLLIGNRHLFVSKYAGERHLGYMASQRKALEGKINKKTNREGLVHSHGFDSKWGYHLIRLGLLGKELMDTGEIVLPMHESSVNQLLDIRNGKYTKDEVIELSYSVEADLERSIELSDLPEKGDRKEVSRILHDIYMTTWKEEDND